MLRSVRPRTSGSIASATSSRSTSSVLTIRTRRTAAGSGSATEPIVRSIASRSVSKWIGIFALCGVSEVSALIYIFRWSIAATVRVVVTSAIPSPIALPSDSGVSSRRKIRRMNGARRPIRPSSLV